MESQALLLAECLLVWTETGASLAGGQDPVSDCPVCLYLPLTSLYLSVSARVPYSFSAFSGTHWHFLVSTSLASTEKVTPWVGKGWWLQQWLEPTSSQGSQEQTYHHSVSSSLDVTQKAEQRLNHSSQIRKAHSCQGDFPLLL